MRRNRLCAGDFVEPIPNGALLTLEYDENGVFKHVYVGDSPELDFESKEIFSQMIKDGIVPTHTYTNNGTGYVRGVLYSGKVYTQSCGILPWSQVDLLIEDYTKNNVNCNFFAGSVYLTGTAFNGAAQVMNWLKSNKFTQLPNFIITTNDFENRLEMLINQTAFDFENIVGYFVFRKDAAYINMLDNKLDLITSISTECDMNGYLVSTVNTVLHNKLHISYYDVIKFGLTKNDYIVLDDSNHIIHNYNKSDSVDDTWKCKFCGSIYKVTNEFAKCSNDNCLSHMYTSIAHFLNKLGLPELSYTDYVKHCKANDITKFGDILDLELYRDCTIENSLYDIIDAIVPIPSVRDRNEIWKLYSACNGSFESVNYYMDHPDKIRIDLNIDIPEFEIWLSDYNNAQKIRDIITYTNVVLIPHTKKFEGSPIFRGNKFYITGKFVCGSYAEVASILASYDGEVVDKPELATIGLVGDIAENVNGGNINKLIDRGCTIFTETELFNQYNLVSTL